MCECGEGWTVLRVRYKTSQEGENRHTYISLFVNTVQGFFQGPIYRAHRLAMNL